MRKTFQSPQYSNALISKHLKDAVRLHIRENSLNGKGILFTESDLKAIQKYLSSEILNATFQSRFDDWYFLENLRERYRKERMHTDGTGKVFTRSLLRVTYWRMVSRVMSISNLLGPKD